MVIFSIVAIFQFLTQSEQFAHPLVYTDYGEIEFFDESGS